MDGTMTRGVELTLGQGPEKSGDGTSTRPQGARRPDQNLGLHTRLKIERHGHVLKAK